MARKSWDEVIRDSKSLQCPLCDTEMFPSERDDRYVCDGCGRTYETEWDADLRGESYVMSLTLIELRADGDRRHHV